MKMYEEIKHYKKEYEKYTIDEILSSIIRGIYEV